MIVHSHALKSLGMTGGLVFTWQVFVIPLVFGVVVLVTWQLDLVAWTHG